MIDVEMKPSGLGGFVVIAAQLEHVRAVRCESVLVCSDGGRTGEECPCKLPMKLTR